MFGCRYLLAGHQLIELCQGISLNLANTLSCQTKFTPDFLQRQRLITAQPEAQTQYLSFSGLNFTQQFNRPG
jgi:hypothetical protein